MIDNEHDPEEGKVGRILTKGLEGRWVEGTTRPNLRGEKKPRRPICDDI